MRPALAAAFALLALLPAACDKKPAQSDKTATAQHGTAAPEGPGVPGPRYNTSQESNAKFLADYAGLPGVTKTADGLMYRVIKSGDGKTAQKTDDQVTVLYKGQLIDGTVFDKSQQPAPMPLSGVLPGFAEALKLMPKGAKYRFWLPAKIGYGDKAAGAIPPNSDLVFDVELIDFIPEAVLRQMQAQQSMMGVGGPGAIPGGAPGVPSPR